MNRYLSIQKSSHNHQSTTLNENAQFMEDPSIVGLLNTACTMATQITSKSCSSSSPTTKTCTIQKVFEFQSYSLYQRFDSYMYYTITYLLSYVGFNINHSSHAFLSEFISFIFLLQSIEVLESNLNYSNVNWPILKYQKSKFKDQTYLKITKQILECSFMWN